VPKDGPSAGITMATAIASVATGRPVSEEVAMTGELTLSGQVLPIGGLREKALAAQRARVKKVVFPRENESDLEELPEETRKEIEFIPVDSIEEVLQVAFDGSLPRVATPRPLTRERKAAASR
jgi:ATP-dependent Lon protease